jgi:kynurenine formamidase
LPFALDWEKLSEIEELPAPLRMRMREMYKRRKDLMKKFYAPMLCPCAVIDLRRKLDIILDRREIPYDPAIDTDTLDISEDAFIQLHKDLEIASEDLAPLSGAIKGKIVLFRTGWEQFQTGDSYNHPRWEAWSLYLTYPYLGESGTKFILNEGVEGVGSDTADLEDPLFYVLKNKSRQPYLTLRTFKETQLSEYRPLHTNLLSEGKWLLEGLSNLKSIPCETNKTCFGYLLICPFPVGSEECEDTRIDDAMPLTLYYLPTK